MKKVDPKVISALMVLRPGLSSAAIADPQNMTRDDFLALQSLSEKFDDDHAQGRDFLSAGDGDGAGDGERFFRDVQRAVSDLMDASPWTLHPDHGCVLAADVDRLDAGSPRERFTVKLVSERGSVIGTQRFDDPVEAMRAYSALRHSQFGRTLGAGAHAALVDEECQYDASYLHEGLLLYREQFAKDAGRELALQVLREDLTSADRRVAVQASSLSDDRLNWAVADSLGFKISDGVPTWVLGGRQYGVAGMDVSGAPLFQPTAKPELAQNLMEMEGIGVREIGDGHWRAMSEDGSKSVDGCDMLTAGLRAIVLQRSGEKVSVPMALAATWNPNEPLVDAVVMERVAAHYTDYFRGPVSCQQEPNWKTLQWEQDAKNFSISASQLPGHVGSPNYPANRWTLGDVLPRAKAVAIARAYPEVRAERDQRAAVLLGKQPPGEFESGATRDALRGLQNACSAIRGASPSLEQWATMEWGVATSMLDVGQYTPQAIAQAMACLSPACVIPEESRNLDTWLCSEVKSREGLEALRKAQPDGVQMANQ